MLLEVYLKEEKNIDNIDVLNDILEYESKSFEEWKNYFWNYFGEIRLDLFPDIDISEYMNVDKLVRELIDNGDLLETPHGLYISAKVVDDFLEN